MKCLAGHVRHRAGAPGSNSWQFIPNCTKNEYFFVYAFDGSQAMSDVGLGPLAASILGWSNGCAGAQGVFFNLLFSKRSAG